MTKRWICGLLAAVLLAACLPNLPMLAWATEQTTDMTVSDDFIEVLKKMEGFHGVPYWDYAQWTVGYGTRVPADKEGYWTETNPITQEEALELLAQELAYFESEVNKFAQKWGLKLKQHQFDALVSFSYNCGAGWTGETSGYLNAAVRSGDMSNALIYGMCLWSTAGGNYILIPRRMSEANMYINGEYKSYTEGSSYPAAFKHVFLDGNGGTPKYAMHGYNAADPAGIVTDFKDIPTGKDAGGNWFVYEFAGWFTEPVGGTQVTVLDGSLPNATVLYAQWKDPTGKTVSLPKGELVPNLSVNVTANVNVRTGPGTYYGISDTIKASQAEPKPITVTEVYTSGSTTWGKFADGWVSLNYTNYKDVVAALPGEPFPRAATVLRNEVNTRLDHSTSAETSPLGKLNKGTKITIVEEFRDGNMLWGKMDNGYWICMDNRGEEYVSYDSNISPTLVSVAIKNPPRKLQYVQKSEELDITGSVIVATYSDGSQKARTVAREYISGFDDAKLGKQTLSVRYLGMTASFEVEIVKATVTFQNYDGSVLHSGQYAYGDAVTAPGVPARPADEKGTYVFQGWDKEITPCAGNAVYTAVFQLIPEIPDHIPGDIDMSGAVGEDDVIHLLYYVVFPDQYPVTIPADFNGDGMVNEDDVLYLLYHVVFPDQYPLTPVSEEGKSETQ